MEASKAETEIICADNFIHKIIISVIIGSCKWHMLKSSYFYIVTLNTHMPELGNMVFCKIFGKRSG